MPREFFCGIFMVASVASNLLALSFTQSAAQSLSPKKWPLCMSIQEEIDRMPSTSKVYNVIGDIKISGISRPTWESLDSRKYLDLIHQSYNSIYDYTDFRESEDASEERKNIAEEKWKEIMPRVMRDIENGSLKVEKTTVDFGNTVSQRVNLIRIRRLISGAGSFENPNDMKELREEGWFYVDLNKKDKFVGTTKISSKFIQSDYFNIIDLFKYHNRYYFLGIPYGGLSPTLYRASLPEEMSEADRICDLTIYRGKL